VIHLAGAQVSLGGQPVLRGVDLHVDDGEWVAVVGPNGAGKSTLLRHVAGLGGGTSELAVDGRDLRTLRPRERARLVALVVQSPTIPEGITVAEYVLLGRHAHIRPFGVEGPADLAAVHDALARLDLLDLPGRVLSTLSGGERQRVLLARALAQEAPVLLLDEPTTALDIGHQQQVLEAVDQLRRAAGLTVLTTMHDLTLAAQYADRLVLLDAGTVTAQGTAAEVLTPEHLSRHYGANVRIVDDGGRPAVIPIREARDARRP
jgi:iron complex transport system ATP-binding protein